MNGEVCIYRRCVESGKGNNEEWKRKIMKSELATNGKVKKKGELMVNGKEIRIGGGWERCI